MLVFEFVFNGGHKISVAPPPSKKHCYTWARKQALAQYKKLHARRGKILVISIRPMSKRG